MTDKLRTTDKPETTAIKAASPQQTVRELINSDRFKDEVARALPAHITPDRFIRVALTAMTKTPKLAECTQASLFQCLLSLSQLGIEPDGRRAHLIPYWNGKQQVTECSLIIDYKGYVELIMRTGKVSKIHADVVCEKDEFEYNIGEITKHKINFKEPRGEVYAAYCIVQFKDGTSKCEVLSKDEVETVRKSSKAGTSGPWVQWWNEMAKKTAARRTFKWVEISPEIREAMDADDQQFQQEPIRPSAPVAIKPIAIKLPEVQVDPPADEIPMVDAEPEVEKKENEKELESFDPETVTELVNAIFSVSTGPVQIKKVCKSIGVDYDTLRSQSVEKLSVVLEAVKAEKK